MGPVIVVSRGLRTIVAMSEIQTQRARTPAMGSARAAAPKTALLVVEEPCVRDLISAHLHAIGWFPVSAPSSQEGCRLASQVLPDVVVMDLDSPATADSNWFFELARSNTSGKRVHTVVLTSAVGREGRADDPFSGADLWVSKPLDANDLMVRLARLMRPLRVRPSTPRAKPALRFARIELDRHQPTIRVRLAGSWLTLDLARTEHRLLEFLLSDPARVHSRESIRDFIWPEAPIDLRTVDQYVRRLRRTLGTVDAGNLIGTVVGAGYRLRLEVLDRATN
jgi:two-component system phosphate regulon response regulator PhoB